ncbi:ATP-binding cassette subfamily B protein [Kroppenstedtia sanguinis]|uniref:ABC transporter ATP-binding protein n=2 Tax=Kroppenstedtia sanguinis TaxID=1380684 RepID=A0ABW4C892_9BACL
MLALIPLASIWLMKELINELVYLMQEDTRDWTSFVLIFLTQMMALISGQLLKLLSEVNDLKLEKAVGRRLEKDVLNKVSRIPYLTFENPQFYDHYQRVTNSQFKVMELTKKAIHFGGGLVTLVSVLLYIVGIHWGLGVILLICSIPMLLIDLRFGRRRYKMVHFLTPFRRKEMYLSHLLNTRETLKEVHMFGLGKHLIKEWEDVFDLDAKENIRLLRRQNFWLFVGECILTLTYIVSGFLVASFIFAGRIKVGDFVSILQGIQSVQSSLTESTRTLSQFYEDSLYMEDLRSFFLIKESEQNEKSCDLDEIKELSVENLSFQYNGQLLPVLKDISFRIRKGQKVALIGENGCGKTTLIKCLAGLYETAPSMIQINGQPLTNIKTESYRKRISVLFQDYIQYNFTARENIGFGNVKKLNDIAEIQRAAKSTGIDSYLTQLPYQYETMLGKFFAGSDELSGGQWQKIALSRALYRNSDLMILDEPTSALDPRAEMEIIEDLFRENNQKAILFITHRLGAASLADMILVMKEGQIVERGTHEELLLQNGIYKKMYRTQSKWYKQKEEVERV